MDDLNQKILAVVRDSAMFLSGWYFDSGKNQVVFVSKGGVPFRIGYDAIHYTAHNALCEWIRVSVNTGVN